MVDSLVIWAVSGVLLSIPDSSDELRLPHHKELHEVITQQLDHLNKLEAEIYSVQEQLISESEENFHQQKIMQIYGFFETGFQRFSVSEEDTILQLIQTLDWTFILGDLNLYIDIKPNAKWRLLVETRINTSIGVPTNTNGNLSFEREIRIRGNQTAIGVEGDQLASTIVLERAYIEYTYQDYLALRLGLWLTPFGNWSMDHGAPTLIALGDPFFHIFQAYPYQQLGLELFGHIFIGDWNAAYYAGISNGRMSGPDYTEIKWTNYDFSNDKMLSGRFELSNTRHHLKSGLSLYWGTTDSVTKQPGVSTPNLQNVTSVELEEWGIGMDISYDHPAFRLRFEGGYTEYLYHKGRLTGVLGGFRADSGQFEGYLIAAFPFSLFGIRWEPYSAIQFAWWPAALAPREAIFATSPGFNLHFTSKVQLKNQLQWAARYNYIRRQADFDKHPHDIISWSTRLVLSF